MNAVRNERNELTSSGWLESEVQKRKRLEREYSMEIAPFLAVKARYLNMYSRMIYNPSTGDIRYEYPANVQAAIDNADQVIAMVREHFLSNTEVSHEVRHERNCEH